MKQTHLKDDLNPAGFLEGTFEAFHKELIKDYHKEIL